MCTIAVMRRVHPDFPLIVAANRDEFYARAATRPVVLHDAPRAVGGRDVEAGGTWMGATQDGFFVGITNQRSWGRFSRAPRSRGTIALRALAAGSVEAARDAVRGIDPSEHSSFNLIYGDASNLEVAYGRREAGMVELQRLGEGIHVLTNDRIGSPDFPKADRALTLVAPAQAMPWPELARALHTALGDHELPSEDRVPEPPPDAPFGRDLVRQLQALCIHTPAYGTRSSTLMALGESSVLHYLYADGPPCTTPYRDVSDLFQGERAT